MLRVFIILILSIYNISTLALYNFEENKKKNCEKFIHNIAFSNGTIKPTISEIQNQLEKSKETQLPSDVYFWGGTIVTFINGYYVEHIGSLYLSSNIKKFYQITPDYLISILGSPQNISHETNHSITWKCPKSSSSLSVILAKNSSILKYFGKYCSNPNPNFCKDFAFTIND